MTDQRKYSISFIMPAFNEEENLSPSVAAVVGGIIPGSDYEIIIFNDGSTDSTGAVAENLARENNNIRVVHNETNMNLGYIIKRGLSLAKKDYFVIAPSHNRIESRSYLNIMNVLNGAEVIAGYIVNPNLYPWNRRIISVSYTILLNLLFNLRVKYYHFPVLLTSAARRVQISTDSYAAMPEIMIRLLKSGATYAEVPAYIKERHSGQSKALRLKNLLGIFRTLAILYWDVVIRGKNI